MAPPPPPPPPSTALTTILTNFQTLYQTTIHPHLPSPLQTISSQLSTTITPFVTPIFASGDIVSLAAFLLCLYLSIRIADYIRRSILSWIFFVVKICMILFVIQVVFYVQAYGVEKALRDAGWIGGVMWGFVEEVYNNAGQGGQGQGRGKKGGGYAGGKGWNVSGGRQQAQQAQGRMGRWR